MSKFTRRAFFKAAGAAVAVTAVDARAAAGSEASASKHPAPYSFFKPDETNFIEAAVERLIPADENGPGALEAGVPSYLDKQLGGAWGAGERLYRTGPWHPGTPTQGYQLPFTPAELFRHALRGIKADLSKRGVKSFGSMSAQEQDKYLDTLQNGDIDLDGVPSKVFFESLLGLTIEGYLSDPVYGGNKDMAAWKMIGFPGAYATYYNLVDQHGIQFNRAPMSLGEDVRGRVHLHPNIPAYGPHEVQKGK